MANRPKLPAHQPCSRTQSPRIDAKNDADASTEDDWDDDNEIDHYILTAAQVRLLASLAKHPVKTWEARTVAVAYEIMAMLKPLCEGKARTALLRELGRKGGPLRPPRTTHWFTRAVIKAQGTDPTFPDHLNAQAPAYRGEPDDPAGAEHQEGAPPVGHKTAPRTVDRYGHLYGDDLDEIGFALSAALA